MTRIIAGLAKGRRLTVPDAGTRPTSDRVREALFSALEHRAQDVTGMRVLDLFAGSGALGLEALSRGADTAVLVERDRRACEVLRANVERIGLDGAHVLCDDVTRLTRAVSTRGRFDLVLMDPPYEMADDRIVTVVQNLVDGSWLSCGAMVVVERSVRSGDVTWPVGFTSAERRTYGDTVVMHALWYGPSDQIADETESASNPGPGG